MAFIVSVFVGIILTFVFTPVILLIGRTFQLWRVLPERTVLV